jgi:hypothetical protein
MTSAPVLREAERGEERAGKERNARKGRKSAGKIRVGLGRNQSVETRREREREGQANLQGVGEW